MILPECRMKFHAKTVLMALGLVPSREFEPKRRIRADANERWQALETGPSFLSGKPRMTSCAKVAPGPHIDHFSDVVQVGWIQGG